MATKTINQKITITGGDEIARTLRDLARLGEETFRQLGDAAKKIDLNLPTDKVKQQLQELATTGQQAFVQLGQAAQGSVSSISQVGTASQQAAQGIAQISLAAQRASQDVAAIGPSAQQSMGGVQQQASTASTAISGIGTAVKTVSATLGALSLVFTGLAATAVTFGKNAADAVVSIGRAADKSGQSLRQYQELNFIFRQLGLSSAEADAKIKDLGTSLNNVFVKARAEFAKFNIRFPEGEAGIKGMANMIRDLGNVTSNTGPKLDSLTRFLVQAHAAFDPLTGKIKEGTGALILIGEALKNLPNSADAARIATQLFGEQGKKIVEDLRSGRKSIADFANDFRNLGLGLSEAQRKIGEDFESAMERFNAAVRQGRTEMGLLFAEPLTPIINAWTNSLRANQQQWIALAGTLSKLIVPLIQELTNWLFKAGETDRQTGIQKITKAFEEFGKAVSAIFTNVIKPAFVGLITLATEAATVLTTMFGTKVTPTMVALGAALTLLLGPIKAVGVALLALFGTEGGAGFDAFKNKLKEFGVDLDAIKTKIRELVDDIKLLAQGGQDTEVKNQWLLDLKNALIEFGSEIPKGIVSFGLMAAAIIRIIGPARAAQIVLLHMSGALNLMVTAGRLLFAVFGTLSFIVNILHKIGPALLASARGAAAVALTLTPMGIALRALGAVILIVATNLDTLFAAWAGIEALGTGNLDRAEKAFGLMGVGAKQAQAGVAELRAELEKDPNLTGWEKFKAFFSGFLKGEQDAIKRDWDRFWNEELPGIVKLAEQLGQPLAEGFQFIFERISIAWEGMLLQFRIAWNTFIEALRANAGIFGQLLPKTDTADQIAQRVEALRQRMLALQQDGRSATRVVEQGFRGLETQIARTETALNGAKQGLDALKQGGQNATATANQVAAAYRQIRPGVFERIATESKTAGDKIVQNATATANKVAAAYRQIRPGVFERIVTESKTAAPQIVQPIVDAVKTVEPQVQQLTDRIAEAFAAFDASSAIGGMGDLEAALERIRAAAQRANEELDKIKRGGDDEGKQAGEPQRQSFIKPEIDWSEAIESAQDAANVIKAALTTGFDTDITAQAGEKAGTAFKVSFTENARPVVDWSDIGQGAAEAAQNVAQQFSIIESIETLGDALIAPFQQALDAITPIVDQIKAKIAEIAQALAQLGSGGAPAAAEAPGAGGGGAPGEAGAAGGGDIGGIGQQILAALDAALAQIQVKVSTANQAIVAAFQSLGPQIAAALAQIVLVDPFQPLVFAAQNAINAIIAAFSGLAQAATAPFQSMQFAADAAMSGISQVVSTGFQSMVSVIESVAQQIDAIIQQIIASLQAAVAEAERLAAAAREAAAAASSAGGDSGFARGGYTGDIGIRRVAGVVHGGEYVQPAHIVRQPGVRAFMETLRRVGDLRKAIRYFIKDGFSFGGYVNDLSNRMSSALIPGYAAGGLVPQAATTKPRNLGVLRLVAGNETFEVMADDKTAFKLQRLARRQVMTSGGRAPVWER